MMVTMLPSPFLRAMLVVAGFSALAGCSTGQGEDPAPDPDVTSPGAEVRLVDETDPDANFTLVVTNQSYDDEEVQLEVKVDGATVVDGDFHVEGQHNYVSYPLVLRPGTHELTAASDDFDEALQETFEVPQGKDRFGLIEHWTRKGNADLDWQLQRQGIVIS